MSYPKDGAPNLDECFIYCVNLYLSIQVRFNPKQLGGGGGGGGGQIDPLPYGFSKNVSSKEMVTLKIMLKHIFPENSIEFRQVIRK